MGKQDPRKPRADLSSQGDASIAGMIQATLDSWNPGHLPTRFERRAERQAAVARNGEQLFTVGEVSELVGLSPGRIRSWERRYRFLKPRRGPTNWRLYTLEDIEVLRRIKQSGAPHPELHTRRRVV